VGYEYFLVVLVIFLHRTVTQVKSKVTVTE